MKNLNEIYKEGIRKLEEINLLNWCEAGAGTKATMVGNSKALQNIYVYMRTLHEKFEVDTSTSILRKNSAAPFCPAPLGGASKIHDDADEYIVKAASELGIPTFLSDGIKKDIGELVKTSDTPIFLVLSPRKDINEMESLIRKGEKAGIAGFGVNIDISFGAKFGDEIIELDGIGPTSEEYFERIRELTDSIMFLKGILHPEDAMLAKELGYDAIIISNHGGRVLDYACSPLFLISKIKELVGKKIEVFVDSGFRTAMDIYKGLALGADAVLLGRPILYGLAAGGKDGVKDVLSYLMRDLKRIMAMTGARDLRSITKDNIKAVES
jgi:isopentenyl diphosphate isomerase/L-lactate dehydrogenase-like FMN-dependent dehydrogenase